MRRLVAARLRYQPAQAVLVTLLAALVSLSAVLGVAYARAVEASVQHQTLVHAAVSARGVSLGSTAESPPSPLQRPYLVRSFHPLFRWSSTRSSRTRRSAICFWVASCLVC